MISGAQNSTPGEKQGVRFASENEEIEPVKTVHDMTADRGQRPSGDDLSPEAKEEIRNLAMTLQKSKIQENRMSNFHFEPYSLPASRVSAALTRDIWSPRLLQGGHSQPRSTSGNQATRLRETFNV